MRTQEGTGEKHSIEEQPEWIWWHYFANCI